MYFIASNGWCEVRPYKEELKFGNYVRKRGEPIMVNLAFVKQVRQTEKRTQEGERLFEIYDGSYPSVMVEEQVALKLREFIFGNDFKICEEAEE